MNVYDMIRRPLITEKGHISVKPTSTMCFEVHKDANKIEIRQAVETVFKVKVSEVRTSVFAGKLRRRGRLPVMRPIGRRHMCAWFPVKKCPSIRKSKRGSCTPCL